VAREKCIQGFGGKYLRKGIHLEDLGIDGRIILRWNLHFIGYRLSNKIKANKICEAGGT
jgi:hypothetical protein